MNNEEIIKAIVSKLDAKSEAIEANSSRILEALCEIRSDINIIRFLEFFLEDKLKK